MKTAPPASRSPSATALSSVAFPGATDGFEALNGRLSRLLRCPPAPLYDGGSRSQADSLLICGVLGGKDVGKSTLIDALAGRAVSVSDGRTEASAGTSRPRAYVHEASVDAVRARLAGDDAGGPTWEVDVTTHDVDAIRDAVLVDFPDFDSEFPQHVEIVRQASGRLDRLVWVITPRKIADRKWVDLFHRVAKDAPNVHCVLNKLDELVAEQFAEGVGAVDPGGAARRLWADLGQWAEDLIARSGCHRRSDRLFLIAAGFAEAAAFTQRVAQAWDDPDRTRYGDDYDAVSAVARLAVADLDRLRDCVLTRPSADEIARIKRLNRVVERQHAIQSLRHHYDLPRWEQQLDAACSPQAVQSLTNQVFGREYCAAVARRLAARRRGAIDLADELFAWRVERWPILRAVYYPLSWLIRRLGRSVLPASRGTPATDGASNEALMDVGSRTLIDRSRLLISRFTSEHGRLITRLELGDRMPDPSDLADGCVVAANRIVEHLDRQAVDSLKLASRSPGWLARALLYATLIWFPLAQPLMEGGLELLAAADGNAEVGASVAHGLYTLVRALRADRLVLGFAVVIGIYVAGLALMYARCVREVRAQRGEGGHAFGAGPTLALGGLHAHAEYSESMPPSGDPGDFGDHGDYGDRADRGNPNDPADRPDPGTSQTTDETRSWPHPSSADPADEVDRLITEEIVAPVLRPLLEARETLAGISGELTQWEAAS